MPDSADVALEELKKIAKYFSAFVDKRGEVSESDTRVKMIDRVLTEVCGWPEAEITREDHVAPGYTDYQLRVRNKPYVVVEAKREGVSFVTPHGNAARNPKLSGALMTEANIKSAVEQVRTYCDNQAAKFAIATNGYCWIVFRAIRDDMPWRNGRATVFPSIEYICNHFTDFWNLLSYRAICDGSLDAEFGRSPASSRQLLRVLDGLFNADLNLARNRLHLKLQPLVKYVFEDIASQGDPDLLKQCYVHANSMHVLIEELDVIIKDNVPLGSAFYGTKPVLQRGDSAGMFDDSVRAAVRKSAGDLYVLLGGIGSGKTTFLKRYEKLIAKDFLQENAFVFHLDLLEGPPKDDDLESFLWKTVVEAVRTSYAGDDLEKRALLEQVFQGRLETLRHTALAGLDEGSAEYEQTVGRHLALWQEDLADYVPRLLRLGCEARRKAAVLIIDNVDQLAPDYQARVFLLAQGATRRSGCLTIIALREESYYAPSIQRSFTAYTRHRFHIASPRFGAMIQNRIQYAIRALERKEKGSSTGIPNVDDADTTDICEFLRIVEHSVFDWSRRVSRFIECLCFGNMRSALQMFTTFLTSGATDVDKMLAIYRRDGGYNVAFHEFVKSIMLEDRCYYKEDESPILNVFNCTAEKNSSHFTALRLLSVLLSRRGESTREGEGYVNLNELVGFFADAFDNLADVTTTLDRLLQCQLVEVNTRSTETVVGGSHIRITAAGWYYLRYLANSFAYLDLVLQDTPLNDAELVERLRRSVYKVNNLADREQEKQARVRVRLDRTRDFLDYLITEEDREFDRFAMSTLPPPLSTKFMPSILETFKKDRAYIEERLAQGRFVDAPDLPEDPDDRQLISAVEEDETVEDGRPRESSVDVGP